MNLNEYDISNPYTATIIKNERLTSTKAEEEVRHIIMNIPDPNFNHIEGQTVGVIVPETHTFDNSSHFRLYSIASTRRGEARNRANISIYVRRCFYNDGISGERVKGIASNYLCDAEPGQTITVTGPYGQQFLLPRDNSVNLLMFGVGTGIAPFRAFIQHVCAERRDWTGKVRLFYGARGGLELLYMNGTKGNIDQFYTRDSFDALKPRPEVDALTAQDKSLESRAEEIWRLIREPKTYVYVAGLKQISQCLDNAISHIAGSREAYEEKKKELLDLDRWAELLYD